MSEEGDAYFRELESEVDAAYALAERARARGEDPTTEVEIPIAKDMADRVQNLLGIPGVADRVRELEAEMSREEAALALAEDFASGDVGDGGEPAEKIEGAVRTAVALLTEGVVAAPIEGIDGVEITQNDDGSEFVSVYYAGPIRSAGGTAQALSVLVADYTRTLLDVGAYQPRDDEIERYAEEVALYDSDTGLQYSPSAAETRFIASHCPICLDGEPTADVEVSGYRDLDRVDTNRPRGGMCLVLAEGIALKAPKIKRYTSALDDVAWPWLDDLMAGNVGEAEEADAAESAASDEPADAGDEDESEDDDDHTHHVGGLPVPAPKDTYLTDLIAGRPVFSHPSREGGFRLRYGRARNHGFATAGVHPATMHLLDDFLATGTQVKTERPGKAAGVVPVDTIEGPTVRLRTGEVRQVSDADTALEIRGGVEAILDVGEYLVNVGEFVENNYELAPASYAPEWWVQELAADGVDVDRYRDDPDVDLERPSPAQALDWVDRYDTPLHPRYTYLWHDVDGAAVADLVSAVVDGEMREGDLVIDAAADRVDTLETILLPHDRTEATVRIPTWEPFVRTLGFAITDDGLEPPSTDPAELEADHGLAAVNALAPFPVRAKAPTRIGLRMGRPEKSEVRELSPAVHTLFPIGNAGGDQRNVSDATRHAESMSDNPGEVTIEIGQRRCPDCEAQTFRFRCSDCDVPTVPHFECDSCGTILPEPDDPPPTCPRCERTVSSAAPQSVDLESVYRDALDRVGERENAFPILKGVKGMMSAEKTPEPMEKGILRAKHGVSTFKDGTIRYDMTDLPVTAVRPDELDVTVDQLREIGYDVDLNGEELRHGDQVVPLKVQDIVLSSGAGEHLLNTADFVDDLLESFYGLDPYYEVEEPGDLVGELVFGMAPHTSAAVVGRIVGFTDAAVGYAHPYFHAAKRRNCLHPETKLWYQDEEGKWRYERIDEFVEERLRDPDTDDFGTEVQQLNGDESVASITDNGKITQQSITAVSKHVSPDHLIKIETEHGRDLRVTSDHRVHVYDERSGHIIDRKAAELNVGDCLLTPAHLDVVSSTLTRFDLLEEFLEIVEIDNDRLMIKGIPREQIYDLFTEVLADDWNGEFHALTSTAEHLEMSKKTLSNYLYRESIPAGLLDQFFSSRDALLDFVPNDVSLGMKRDSTTITRELPLSERVATLIGYYVAEGFARAQKTPKGTIHQTTFCGKDEEMQEFYMDVLSKEFGVEPYIENELKVTVSGRLLRIFFDTVLGAGIFAHTKQIPDPILHDRKEILGAFLSGYFSGDGSINGGTITAITASKQLKEDLLAIFSRLGVEANVSIRSPEPLVNRFPDWYAEDRLRMARPGYQISISTNNVVRLSRYFSFHLPRKDNKFQQLISSAPGPSPVKTDGGLLDCRFDRVQKTTPVQSLVDHVYCLTIRDTNSLICNDLSLMNCDGDEDCVMLLMDGLLNFSQKFLPEQRGGSVAEDSRLLAVAPDGDVSFLTFDAFWDELDSPIIRDGKFRKKACFAEGWQTYVFDDAQQASLQPIEKAIRYPAADDETLLRVETQFGRSIEITGDHSLFRYQEDGIEEVAGDDLREGDVIVAPRSLGLEHDDHSIDVSECVDEPYVIVNEDVEERLRTVWEETPHGSEVHRQFGNGLSYRLARDKLSFEQFEELLGTDDGTQVLREVQIARARSRSGIDRFIAVDERFAWLLGLFVAEGSLSGNNPTIHNRDEELIERACDTIESSLGIEPATRWSNRACEIRLPTVFADVLSELGFDDSNGCDPSGKTIPQPILQGDRDVICSFLRGFIAGDGSRWSDDNVTNFAFHTTSEDVKDGLVFLLHRLGIVANISYQDNRPGTRQPRYTVTVPGGPDANPLERVLDGEEPPLRKSLSVPIPEPLMQIRDMDVPGVNQAIPKYLNRRENVSIETLREIVETVDAMDLPAEGRRRLEEVREIVTGDLSYLRITGIEDVPYDGYLYDLQVGGEPIFTTNWLFAHNSMDAPLVMSTRIDPAEIDDEAHNMDIVEEYPKEFYESTLEMAQPDEIDITLAEETVGTGTEYDPFFHTHDSTNIAAGPDLSAYKTLESMMEKMEAQLELARKLRAVDESDVAERVIESHFLPDLLGNLRAFSAQETRCPDCGEKYRRPPLTQDCRVCGGNVILTVHRGSVEKYMDTALEVAERFDCPEYTVQRLELLKRTIESMFEDDHNKQSGIADFM